MSAATVPVRQSGPVKRFPSDLNVLISKGMRSALDMECADRAAKRGVERVELAELARELVAKGMADLKKARRPVPAPERGGSFGSLIHIQAPDELRKAVEDECALRAKERGVRSVPKAEVVREVLAKGLTELEWEWED